MNSKRYWKPDGRIAELEELVVKVEQQRNTMTAERDKLTEENNRLHDARADDALFAEKKVAQAEAALAERDRMLWWLWEHTPKVSYPHSAWLADLRACAEEGIET